MAALLRLRIGFSGRVSRRPRPRLPVSKTRARAAADGFSGTYHHIRFRPKSQEKAEKMTPFGKPFAAFAAQTCKFRVFPIDFIAFI